MLSLELLMNQAIEGNFLLFLGPDDAGDLSKKIYALDMSLKWATVNTELPEEREMHCQVGYL